VESKWVMIAPVTAIEKLLKKTGWDREKDVDLYELNEEFAVLALAAEQYSRIILSVKARRQRAAKRHPVVVGELQVQLNLARRAITP